MFLSFANFIPRPCHPKITFTLVAFSFSILFDFFFFWKSLLFFNMRYVKKSVNRFKVAIGAY